MFKRLLKRFTLMNEATGGDAGAPSAAPPPSFDSDLARRLSETMGVEFDDGASDAPAQDPKDGDEDTGEGLQARQPDPDKSAPEQTDEGTADPVLTVKVDGQEKQVKQSELIAEFQKGQAASKRFEEAAQLRRATEQAQAQINSERAQLAQALQHYTQQLEAVQRAQEPDWQNLLDNDPAQFQRQRFYYDQRQQQLQQTQAAQAYLAQQQAQVQAQQMQRMLDEGRARLMELVPDWSDPGKAQADQALIRQALTATGYEAHEIEGIQDPRAVVIARKAALYDQMMAAQSKAGQNVTQKLTNLPPPRMERPGNGESVKPTDGRTRAMKALNTSGRVEDAAAVLAHLL